MWFILRNLGLGCFVYIIYFMISKIDVFFCCFLFIKCIYIMWYWDDIFGGCGDGNGLNFSSVVYF